MLYLMDPRGGLHSAETTLGALRAQEKTGGRGFRRAGWQKAIAVLEFEDYVDLALRHGVAVNEGLVLDAGFVEHVLMPSRLRAQQANQERVAAQLEPVRRDTEDRSLALHDRHALGVSADRDLSRRLEKAEDSARDILQGEIRHDLVAHWRRLGGQVPQVTHEELLAEID
ncbi:MAG: hypothetical protein Q4G34_08845 [Micrococcus sp.]|nr:hypothetical protein [Micrococcus sp.]